MIAASRRCGLVNIRRPPLVPPPLYLQMRQHVVGGPEALRVFKDLRALDGLVGGELAPGQLVGRADQHQLGGLALVRAELALRHQVAEVGGVQQAA